MIPFSSSYHHHHHHHYHHHSELESLFKIFLTSIWKAPRIPRLCIHNCTFPLLGEKETLRFKVSASPSSLSEGWWQISCCVNYSGLSLIRSLLCDLESSNLSMFALAICKTNGIELWPLFNSGRLSVGRTCPLIFKPRRHIGAMSRTLHKSSRCCLKDTWKVTQVLSTTLREPIQPGVLVLQQLCSWLSHTHTLMVQLLRRRL